MMNSCRWSHSFLTYHRVKSHSATVHHILQGWLLMSFSCEINNYSLWVGQMFWMKDGSCGQLAVSRQKNSIISWQKNRIQKKTDSRDKNKYHPLSFFQKIFRWNQKYWTGSVTNNHQTFIKLNPEPSLGLSPVSYYLVPCCLVSNFSCLCNLPRVSIDHCLFVCKTSANSPKPYTWL